jgi:hypothetical protein
MLDDAEGDGAVDEVDCFAAMSFMIFSPILAGSSYMPPTAKPAALLAFPCPHKNDNYSFIE